MTSAGNPLAQCDGCKRKHGWKPWEEMTIEEKVENLHQRLGGAEIRNTLF